MSKLESRITIDIDSVIRARLDAERAVRRENDHDVWSYKRVLTQYVLRTLPPLTKEDEQRIAAKCNGNGHEPTPKHRRQKVKPA